MKGFLPTAMADAQVALEQVERADLEGRINDFILYGGYVLNALDPSAETEALLKTAYARLPTTYLKIEVPGSGYGIKRAVAGALQHVQLAAKSEGASDNVKTHASHVIASLENVAKWTDEAIATTRKLLQAKSVGDGQALVDELTYLTEQIANGRRCQQRRPGRLADRRRWPASGANAHAFDDEGGRTVARRRG